MLKSIFMSGAEIVLCTGVGIFGMFLLATLAALLGNPSNNDSLMFARSGMANSMEAGGPLGFCVGCLLVLKRNR